jgi:hypothetical protein
MPPLLRIRWTTYRISSIRFVTKVLNSRFLPPTQCTTFSYLPRIPYILRILLMPVKLKVITVIQILVNSILVILTDVNGAILDFTKWSRACLPIRSTWVHSRFFVFFIGVHVTRSLVLCVMLCTSISLFVLLYFFLLAIVLSVLRPTDSDYPFGIFKFLAAINRVYTNTLLHTCLA